MSSQQPKTHFELFELPPAFAIDRDALDARYRQLQRATHPDRFASAGDRERLQSLQLAAQVNEAYRVLRDPLARARYLLELKGHRFNDERNTQQDPEFLTEQMELREALGEVRANPDPAGALNGIAGRIRERLDALEADLERLFGEGGEAAERAALDRVWRMQFYRRLEEEVDDLEADLEDDAG